MVDDLLAFLGGDTEEVVRRLEDDMAQASAALEFEQAARIRDRLASVSKAIEGQEMVGARSEDYDVVGLVDDELEAACQVFYVRKGRVMGRRGFIVDKAGDLSRDELVSRVLERLVFRGEPARQPQAGSGSRPARQPEPLRRVAAGAAGVQGGHLGAPAGGQAEAPGDGGPQCCRRLRPTPAQAQHRPQQPGPGPQRPPKLPGTARSPPADRVLRHEPPPRIGLCGIDGGDGGRPAPQVGIPPVQGANRGRQR